MALRSRRGAFAVVLLLLTACAAPVRSTVDLARSTPSERATAESSTVDAGGSCGQSWSASIDADATGAASPELLLEEQRGKAAARLTEAEASGHERQVAWAGLRLRLYTELLQASGAIGAPETATGMLVPLDVPGLGAVGLVRLNDGTWAQHEETLLGDPC